jgi:hypothetical protein
MLRGTSDLRGYFRTNRTPIYFISPTAFNLLGIDRWVRGFSYVNYFDSFAGVTRLSPSPANRRRMCGATRPPTISSRAEEVRARSQLEANPRPAVLAVVLMWPHTGTRCLAEP